MDITVLYGIASVRPEAFGRVFVVETTLRERVTAWVRRQWFELVFFVSFMAEMALAGLAAGVALFIARLVSMALAGAFA